MKIPKALLITKADICSCLGYKSMKPIYDKILDEKTIKSIGFESIEEFKRIKRFNRDQSGLLKNLLKELKKESEE